MSKKREGRKVVLSGPCGDRGFCLEPDADVFEISRPGAGVLFTEFAILDVCIETKLALRDERSMLVFYDDEAEHLQVSLAQVKRRRRWPTQIFSGARPIYVKGSGLLRPIDMRIYWEAISP